MSHTQTVPAWLLLGVLIVRPQVSGVAYPFSQGFLLFPILIGLSLVFLNPGHRERAVVRTTGLCFTLPLLLLLWSMVTLLWAPDPGQGARDCFSLLLNLVIFTLAYHVALDAEDIGKKTGVLLALTAVPVLLRALYQRVFGLSRLRDVLESMAASGEDISQLAGVISADRVFAGFLNSNMLAGFCAVIIPVTLDLALTSSWKFRRNALYSLLGAEIVVLILTGSLGGSAAAGIMATAVLGVRRGFRRNVLVSAFALAAVVGGFILVMRGLDFLVGPESSVIQRAGYMAAGVRMAVVSIFAGWGAGSSPGALMGFVAEGIRPVADPHNFLIRSWISWGVPGLAVVLLWLLCWVRSVAAPVREIGWQSCPEGYAGLVFGAGAFLLHSLVDMDFFVPEVAAFGWLAMGAALGSALALSSGEEKGSRVPDKKRFMAGGFALAMVLPSLIFLQGEFTAFRGGRALQEGEYPRAAELLEDAGRILPFNGRFTLDEGRARLASGDAEAAETLFDRADTLMRASLYPNWEMGRLAQSREEWSQSLLHLDVALNRYPTSPRIRIDQALAYLALGDQARAYHLLTEARRLSMFDPAAGQTAKELLMRLGL